MHRARNNVTCGFIREKFVVKTCFSYIRFLTHFFDSSSIESSDNVSFMSALLECLT